MEKSYNNSDIWKKSTNEYSTNPNPNTKFHNQIPIMEIEYNISNLNIIIL